MAGAGTFGVELRRARQEAGLSQADLVKRIHYSKGQLSKIENGLAAPSPALAARCDAVLEAGGRLVAAAARAAPAPRGPRRRTPPETDEPLRPGAAFALTADDDDTQRSLEQMFVQARHFGRNNSPRLVLPQATATAQLVRAVADSARPPVRPRVLDLAARCAEYVGWMAQEAGDDAGARRWTDDAVRLAEAAGDRDLVRYGRVRQAELALYQGRPAIALALLEGVRARPAAARVAGLALQWEAQAHALTGDGGRWRAAVDRSAELLAAPDETGALGSSSAPNGPALAIAAGLLELGRAEEAAEIFDREVPQVPTTARRVAARFGAKRATAHAAAGDPDGALALLPDLLVIATQVDSATVRTDLDRLSRELRRWEGRPAVARARTELEDVLRPC